MIDCDPGNITPLAYSCLAHPSGLCVSKDERFVFVCETGRNRLLRFLPADRFKFKLTVFYQFSGRYGPTDIAVNPESGNLYVSLFEFKGSPGIIQNFQISVKSPLSIRMENGSVWWKFLTTLK